MDFGHSEERWIFEAQKVRMEGKYVYLKLLHPLACILYDTLNINSNYECGTF